MRNDDALFERPQLELALKSAMRNNDALFQRPQLEQALKECDA